MATSHTSSPRTTVNRLLLFLLIGFSTSIPLYVFGLFFFSWINIFFMPLIVLVVLIIMVAREKRASSVRPGWLEYFLAFWGAFYPPVLVAIILWVVWWGAYGLGTLLFDYGDPYGSNYEFAGIVYGVFSLLLASFLVRFNWRHIVDQLYPQQGSQSAFALITESGKIRLFKRGFLYACLFFLLFVVYFVVVGLFLSEGEDFTVLDEFLIGLFFIVVYLFFLSLSAWLWLRQAEFRAGASTVSKMLSDVLSRSGHKVRTITELKQEPGQTAEISDSMTASVDLIASKEDGSLIIDVMTLEETTDAPDWIMASEFRTAAWYLQRVLALPKPVEAFLVLVDVVPDATLFAFTESHNINLIQLTSGEVGKWQAEGSAFFEKANVLLSSKKIDNSGAAEPGEAAKSGEQYA